MNDVNDSCALESARAVDQVRDNGNNGNNNSNNGSNLSNKSGRDDDDDHDHDHDHDRNDDGAGDNKHSNIKRDIEAKGGHDHLDTENAGSPPSSPSLASSLPGHDPETDTPDEPATTVPEMAGLTERQLQQDAFTFLMFESSVVGMIWAFLVLLLQLILFILIALDNFDDNFGLTYNVNAYVIAAGFMAVVIAVVTQDDIRTSLNMWRDGYDHDLFETSFKGSTISRYILSTVARAALGLFSLLASLLLIVQASTVLELLLNFTAIEVISTLDDAAFALAHYGYFGDAIQRDADFIASAVYYVRGGQKQYFRWVTLGSVFAFMFSVWMYAVVQQDLPPTVAPTATPTTYASTCTSDDERLTRIEIFTDSFPEETTWTLYNRDHAVRRVVATQGPFSIRYGLFTEEICLLLSECYEFVIDDQFGDGLVPRVNYIFEKDGTINQSAVDDAYMDYLDDLFFNDTVRPKLLAASGNYTIFVGNETLATGSDFGKQAVVNIFC